MITAFRTSELKIGEIKECNQRRHDCQASHRILVLSVAMTQRQAPQTSTVGSISSVYAARPEVSLAFFSLLRPAFVR